MSLRLLRSVHEDCDATDPCVVDDPASCPVQSVRETRARATAGKEWDELDLELEPGGNRHYLVGKPVHCGEQIELQSTEDAADDYGEYSVPLPRGTLVRYEAQLYLSPPRVTLYASVGGHTFTIALEPWMRFRWPT